MSLFWLIRVIFIIFVWSQPLLFMEHLHTVFTQTNIWCVCEATGVSCPTWLSQHVGKADVWAQAWVHFHPGWHGVKLAMIMELIQKFLCEQKKVMWDRNEKKKPKLKQVVLFKLYSSFCICSPGNLLCFCVAVFSPSEESSASPPPPPSPEPWYAPQNKWGHLLCPYL